MTPILSSAGLNLALDDPPPPPFQGDPVVAGKTSLYARAHMHWNQSVEVSVVFDDDDGGGGVLLVPSHVPASGKQRRERPLEDIRRRTQGP